MAKKKGKAKSGSPAKVRKSKKNLPKGKRAGVKSTSRSRETKPRKSGTSTKPATKKQTPAKKPIKPKKPVTPKKPIKGKIGVSPKKKTGGVGTKPKGRNQKAETGVKKGKRSSRPFKLGGKRVRRVDASKEWNYIRDASYKLPKKAKTLKKTLRGAKDKKRGSEFFGKNFRIKKSIRVFRPSVVDDSTYNLLMRENLRALKLNGKTEKKAYFKAMYIDGTGAIRWASVTRESVKNEQDVSDKIRLLFEKIKSYGGAQFLGYETEEVEDEWEDDLGDAET